MRQTMLARAIFALVACAFVSLVATAGDATTPAPGAGGGGGGAGGGGGRQGRGNFDPAAFQKQQEDALKAGLGVTDEEFTALKPKLDAVQKARRDASTRGGFGGFGGGNFGGRNRGQNADPNAPAPDKTEMQKKSDALKGLLDNKESDPKAVQEALAGLRAEREKAKETLKKAQTELKELLTAKQEAYLVMRGDLE